MRLLLLTPRTPYPPVGGDRLRLYHLVEHLAARHEVTLFTLAESRDEAEHCRALTSSLAGLRTFVQPRAVSLLRSAMALPTPWRALQAAYFRSGRMARAVSAALRGGGVDVAVGSLIRTAPYLLGAPVPVVIDVQDSLSLHYRRALRFVRGYSAAVYGLEAGRVERLERAVLRRATAVTAISEVDRDDLLRRVPGARVVLSGNGVDGRRFRPVPGSTVHPARLVFLANLRTVANRDMARCCAREILPRVRAVRPAAHLHVVGADPAADVRALADGAAVRVTGPVAHPADHLRGAVLTLCPMRFGAGVQNKVLESLAVGTPAVVSPMAATPLGLADGEGVLIADGPEEQARACLRVLDDRALRERLARAGRAVVEERFDWASNLAPLEELIREVVSERRGRTVGC